MKATCTYIFYYPYNKSFSGGPRTIINLLTEIDRKVINPIFVTQKETPLSDALLKIGVEVLIIPLPDILNEEDGKTLRYSFTKKVYSVLALLEYNKKIAKIASDHTVVGMWGRGVKSTLLIGFCAHLLNVPLVWDIGLEKDSKGLMKLIHLLGLCLSTKIVTQSRSQPESIFGRPLASLFSSKLYTIPPGISEERILQIESSKLFKINNEFEEFKILSVGTIHPRKNQMLLIKALNIIISRKYENVQISLIGSTEDEEYLKDLKDFIQSNHLEYYIRFVGWCDNVPLLMNTFDLLVICSRNEGLPHVVREAMWAGIPIVSTTTGALKDVIDDEISGFLLREQSELELANRIEHCMLNSEILEKISLNAYEYAKKNFSNSSWGQQYTNLLHNLIVN